MSGSCSYAHMRIATTTTTSTNKTRKNIIFSLLRFAYTFVLFPFETHSSCGGEWLVLFTLVKNKS